VHTDKQARPVLTVSEAAQHLLTRTIFMPSSIGSTRTSSLVGCSKFTILCWQRT
jgi:hypothetical protein